MSICAAVGIIFTQFVLSGSGASAAAGGRVHVTELGALGSPSTTSAVTTSTVVPTVSSIAGGGVMTTYALPGGQAMSTPTPPVGFDPLAASAAELQEFDFPARPTDPEALADWTTAMTAYRSDDPPTGSLAVATSAAGPGISLKNATQYSNWAGYIDGKENTQSHTYVAVKDDMTVPSASSCAPVTNLGMWIGLGGTSSNVNSLVQQGIVCGNTDVGTGSAWRPFTEFADTQDPIPFCAQKTWTFAAGHLLYQNMSYQVSSNRAYFYLEDETTGVAHSCSLPRPSGWSYDDNTAEWISEAPNGLAANFGSVHFTNAQAELDSNSSWVTLGSQTYNKTIAGYSSSEYCISPGSIGSNKESFTNTWHEEDC